MSFFNKVKTPIIYISIFIGIYLVLSVISHKINTTIKNAENIPSDTINSIYDSAKMIAKDISNYLNFTPKINVDKVTVVQKELPILELATLELKNVKHNYTWSNKWLGSEKNMNMTGYFDVKIGFDLNKNFILNLTTNKTAEVILPKPKVLSVELKNSTLTSENGWINKINDNDRNEVINGFTASMRNQVSNDVYFNKSKNNIENVFKKIIDKRLDGFSIKYKYDEGK